MVRHIVMWNHRDEMTETQRLNNGRMLKFGLESLKDKIEGVISAEVIIKPLESSTMHVVLNSLFESPEALSAYATHPEHEAVKEFIHSAFQDRVCIDYLE